MPLDHLLDKLIGRLKFSPLKCRACKAKFYRRSSTVPKRPTAAPVMNSGPVPKVSACHRDVASTLQRVEQIILVAENARLRKG